MAQLLHQQLLLQFYVHDLPSLDDLVNLGLLPQHLASVIVTENEELENISASLIWMNSWSEEEKPPEDWTDLVDNQLTTIQFLTAGLWRMKGSCRI